MIAAAWLVGGRRVRSSRAGLGVAALAHPGFVRIRIAVVEYGRGKVGASTAPRRRPQKPSHARRRAASRRRERALRSALPAPARDARRARARALSHLSTQTLHGRCVAAVSRHNHRAAARRSARAAVSRARLSPAAQAKTNSMPQGLTRTTLVTVPALVPRCSRRSRLSSVASPRSRPHGGATGRASDTPLRAVRLHILRLVRRGCLRVRFKKVPCPAPPRHRGTGGKLRANKYF